jgi:hypothetical protein
MRLIELDPHWITLGSDKSGDDRLGITFRCPHCPPGERGETTFLGVWFVEPVDPNEHPEINWPTYMLQHPERKYWHRTGESFETLTLSPSVDASKVGHWHGFITNGEVS